MESSPQINPAQNAPKSNRNLIISVVIAIVLLCCCVVAAVAGYYGYRAYLAAQQAVQQFEGIQIPTDIPFDPNQIPEVTGEAPQGGLADDSTRYTAWVSIQLVGLLSSCESPTAQSTTIRVDQQPDGSGEWVEDWNVDCGNGSFQSYKVTFTPENGVVNVNVELP